MGEATTELLRALLVSCSLGALLGLERQWDRQREDPHGDPLVGVRTFTLWAALGTLCSFFSAAGHPVFFVAGFLALALFLSVFLLGRGGREDGFGFTTATVAMLTYLLGGLVWSGHTRIAVVLAVSMILLLAAKERLHRLSLHFSANDVRLALQFAAVTGVVLPLVPDRALGPYDSLNPFTIWLMVVLVSGLGFLGYVAMRLFGTGSGLALTGLLGGVASSTATTLAMSRQSRAEPATGPACALAVILACTVMLGRLAVLVGALNPGLLWRLTPGLLLTAAPGLLASALLLHSLRKSGTAAPGAGATTVRNPLSLPVALQFAALYAVIVLAVRWAGDRFGDTGIAWVSFFSGLTDLDAIALSLAQMSSGGSLGEAAAAQAILLAAAANSLLKGGLAAGLGSNELRRPVLLGMGATVAAAGWAAWRMT